MRQLICSLSVVGFLSVLAGCHHTAGACDCNGPHGVIVATAPIIKPEPIKELPKEREIKKINAEETALETDGN
ncbi:MAG: hypothetical protein ACJ8FY_15920 [Gemmataceae bacterium]